MWEPDFQQAAKDIQALLDGSVELEAKREIGEEPTDEALPKNWESPRDATASSIQRIHSLLEREATSLARLHEGSLVAQWMVADAMAAFSRVQGEEVGDPRVAHAQLAKKCPEWTCGTQLEEQAKACGSVEDAHARIGSPDAQRNHLATSFSTPLVVPLQWLRNDAATESSLSKKDASARQAALDIERDVIRVNCQLRHGVEGVDTVVRAIQKAAVAAQRDIVGTTTTGAVDEDVAAELAMVALKLGNRTESGGAAYDALLRLVVKPGVAIAVAHSQAASPIEVVVDSGPFEVALPSPRVGSHKTTLATSRWEWGVRAHVSATTVYKMCDPDPTSEETATWGHVHVTYVAQVGVSVQDLVGGDATLRREPVVHSCGSGPRCIIRASVEGRYHATPVLDAMVEEDPGEVCSPQQQQEGDGDKSSDSASARIVPSPPRESDASDSDDISLL